MAAFDKSAFLMGVSAELKASQNSPEGLARANGKLDGFKGVQQSKKYAQLLGTDKDSEGRAYAEGYKDGAEAKSEIESSPRRILGLGRRKKATRSRKTRSRKTQRSTKRKH